MNIIEKAGKSIHVITENVSDNSEESQNWMLIAKEVKIVKEINSRIAKGTQKASDLPYLLHLGLV